MYSREELMAMYAEIDRIQEKLKTEEDKYLWERYLVIVVQKKTQLLHLMREYLEKTHV